MNAARNPAPTVSYNEEMAEAADAGQRLSETGEYVGAFTKFKWTVAQSGAAGYMFDFESNDGRTAERLSIYTVGKDGKPLDIGERKIRALLCCLGVAQIVPKLENVKESVWNDNTKKYEDQFVSVDMYPDAMNRPIGLILQKELTTKRDGGDSYRMNFFASFHHESRRNAAEMIKASRATKNGGNVEAPEFVDSVMKTLGDKDSRELGNGPYTGNQPSDNAPTHSAEFSDDLPF